MLSKQRALVKRILTTITLDVCSGICNPPLNAGAVTQAEMKKLLLLRERRS
jgi:hypothetical protein